MSSSFVAAAASQSSARTGSRYFDIDDILATNQKMPCQFDQAAIGLGFIDPSSDDRDVPVGAKLELPLWLARALAIRRRPFVVVELPVAYRTTYRDILSADANVVDLHKLGPFFYDVGMKLLEFEHDEREALSRTLLETFLNRFRRIMDLAQNAFHEDTSTMTEKLDNVERWLFDAGQTGTRQFEIWERMTSSRLVASTAAVNHRKRKRDNRE